jgi:hypothetical protein
MMRHVVFEQNDAPRRPFADMRGKIAALPGGINEMLIADKLGQRNAEQGAVRRESPARAAELKRPEGRAAGHCPNASGPQNRRLRSQKMEIPVKVLFPSSRALRSVMNPG